jgi:hypothetical protein
MKKLFTHILSFLTEFGRATSGRKPIPDSPADPYEKISRFEVIDHTRKRRGRIVVEYGVQVEMSIQDDGRTMKIFLTDKKKKV